MTRELRALLVVVGVVAVGGTAILLVRPGPGVTVAALQDAGLELHCDRVTVQCRVKVAEACRGLPDGGQARPYGTVQTGAYACGRDGGSPALVVRWARRGGGDCFEEIGDEACRIVEEGCSDSALCDDATPRTAPVTDECFCRDFSVGACRWAGLSGGGLLQMGRGNVHPGPVVGPGCVPAPCVERAGDRGLSLPPECR